MQLIDHDVNRCEKGCSRQCDSTGAITSRICLLNLSTGINVTEYSTLTLLPNAKWLNNVVARFIFTTVYQKLAHVIASSVWFSNNRGNNYKNQKIMMNYSEKIFALNCTCTMKISAVNESLYLPSFKTTRGVFLQTMTKVPWLIFEIFKLYRWL